MAPSCGISNWQVPYPRNFPRRNKIIIGLVIGTLVVEANIKSELLLTARLVTGQNRKVFDVPGPVTGPQSHGCHQLIKL
jgi:DNA processing protein